jgi:hypothetical protein
MKTWTVLLPIAGTLSISGIEAETEEEAIEKAFEIPYDEKAHDLEWEQFEHLTQGNVLYPSTNDASAEEE